MPASPWLAASNGLITGGALAILADIAFGISVETEHPAATPYTTAKLSLRSSARRAQTMPTSEWLASPTGRVQGGTIAMLADFAMLGAVQTTTPPGLAFAGLDLKVNFLRPVEPDDGQLEARGEVVHPGRTLAITRATVWNDEDKPVLLATGSSIYLPGRPASLGEVELSEPERAAPE